MNPIKTHLLNRLRPKGTTMRTITNEEATVLGSRAVNAGLRIAPGMNTLHARNKWSGGIVTGFDYDGAPAISTGLNEPFSPKNLAPDLRDPGTKGHAIAQLRERMGDPGLTINSRHRTHMIGLAPTALQWWADGSTTYSDTEEEAIVAAFEATKETP